MKKSMVIYGAGASYHHVCPACKIDLINGPSIGNEKIPHFYSEKHAFDAGWRCSNNWKFSSNGRPVWVCPDCWPGDA